MGGEYEWHRLTIDSNTFKCGQGGFFFSKNGEICLKIANFSCFKKKNSEKKFINLPKKIHRRRKLNF